MSSIAATISTDLLSDLDPWRIRESRFRPAMNEHAESIFTLGNEYMGCRGAFEEGYTGPTLPGCYLGGIFGRERQPYVWKRTAFPTYTHSMIHTTNWVEIVVTVDGERFSMTDSEYTEYQREIDLRDGVLTRRLIFRTQSGAETLLQWERLISHADRHMAAIRLSLTALNHTQPIEVSLALDSTKENRDFATSVTHCRMRDAAADAEETYLLMYVQTTGQYYLHRMRVDSNIPHATMTGQVSERRVEQRVAFVPEMQVEYQVDKLVSVWTSRDAGYPHGLIPKTDPERVIAPETDAEIAAFLRTESARHLAAYPTGAFPQIRQQHAAQLAQFWDLCDVEIDGDLAGQQGIRYCMFQLQNAYAGNDGWLNIGPKGYSGECYNGRAFWDSESYCLPYYLFTNLAAARKLLEFRYATLEGARQRAKELRYPGAVFPFTTMDGSEDCATWEYALGEIHSNTTIAYAIYVYTKLTGNPAYLYEKGVEVLVELSRFWAARVDFIPYRNGYAINRVMGPNEYGQCVNNNWYTNYMVCWSFTYTLQAIEAMRRDAPDAWAALASRLGFIDAETARWRDIVEKILLPYDAEREIYPENDMYLSLTPLCREELDRDRDLPIERKWTIEKYQKYQFSKQPDVLLAMFLHRDRFSLEEKRNNYRFYEQRCTHGSSLSPAIHSILAAEVGRYRQAYDYYLWISRLDLDNANNNTEEGLHISSMAGTWMNIVFGFGGLTYTGDCLEFAPMLPEAWTRYAFKFVYRDAVVQVTVDTDGVTLQTLAGPPVVARVYGQELRITAIPQQAPMSADPRPRTSLGAVLFDLDGVIVDTARLHYLAWKALADEEGIYFDEQINERLKGVSRMDSLDIILERSPRAYTDQERLALADRKNRRYVELLQEITPADILPGIPELLEELRAAGLATAICSASKNTDTILARLGIGAYFDTIVSGNDVTRSKPDPEGLLLAAARLGVNPERCVVIEDAFAGVQAARSAGMKSLGIGDKTMLYNADYTLCSTRYVHLNKLTALF